MCRLSAQQPIQQQQDRSPRRTRERRDSAVESLTLARQAMANSSGQRSSALQVRLSSVSAHR